MRNYYQEQIRRSEDGIHKAERAINIYSFLRLVAVILGGVLVYQTTIIQKVWLTELTFFFIVIVFALLVRKQSRLEKEKQYFHRLKEINKNEISTLSFGKNLYSDGTEWIDDHHYYSSDLDIFGPSSLFQLINRCVTMAGNRLLGEWFSAPGEKERIVERHEAIKEISSDVKWIQHFQALLLNARETKDQTIKHLLGYLASTGSIGGKVLPGYLKIAPLLFLILLAAAFYVQFLWVVVIVMALVNRLFIVLYKQRIVTTTVAINKVASVLETYSLAIAEIEGREWKSPLTIRLSGYLRSGNSISYSSQVRRLSALIHRLDLQAPGLIIFALNTACAWQVRQYLAVEDWKQTNHLNVKKAFDIIGEFEAILSLGMVHINYPKWCFPEIVEDTYFTLDIKQAGHPLLGEESRVTNNFNLTNELKIDIVTGSNMAGKSTFLRTLGVNTVLALAGAPACAEWMRITPMTLFSYMRIKDSLAESTSTFKAELNRLRLLLDVLAKPGKVYFLIDEMLRGTNSEDKFRGSKAVIEKLIDLRAAGIVATHDLQLAELTHKYPDYIRNFYFDIQVVGNEMMFDYKLKEGACTTFNASLLLSRLGIEV